MGDANEYRKFLEPPTKQKNNQLWQVDKCDL